MIIEDNVSPEILTTITIFDRRLFELHSNREKNCLNDSSRSIDDSHDQFSLQVLLSDFVLTRNRNQSIAYFIEIL